MKKLLDFVIAGASESILNLMLRILVIVVWLFLAVPWVCLQFVIVVFPDHTHLLFWKLNIFDIIDKRISV